MKDIDFDELDRAVSSVLNQKKPSNDGVAPVSYADENKQDTVSVTTNAAATNDSAQPVTTDQPVKTEATSTAPETPDTDMSEKSEVVETTPTPPTSPLAVKRRGKFMDVMHPSHDMAPGSTTAALPVSKPKHLLEPVSHDVKPEEKDSPVLAPVELEKPVSLDEPAVSEPVSQPEEASSKELEKKPTSLYIDPLELDGKSKDTEPEESVDNPEVNSTESTPETPQPTPFLTDAKVEKRPLGGFSEPETTPAVEQTLGTDAPTEQPVDNQVAPSVPLPRELQPDVVEVEAVHDDTQPPTNDSAKQNTSVESAAPGKTADTNEKTQSHPLFDTSTYHEPTAAKHGGKKSGWVMWVVGFVLCLVIGGGVGYFLFTVGF